MFDTVDLYEERDMSIVVYCLFALGRTIQVRREVIYIDTLDQPRILNVLWRYDLS